MNTEKRNRKETSKQFSANQAVSLNMQCDKTNLALKICFDACLNWIRPTILSVSLAVDVPASCFILYKKIYWCSMLPATVDSNTKIIYNQFLLVAVRVHNTKHSSPTKEIVQFWILAQRVVVACLRIFGMDYSCSCCFFFLLLLLVAAQYGFGECYLLRLLLLLNLVCALVFGE